ncbi:MAG: hypothetical protein PHD06_11345 [Bacteroidales bacterium]|jgi:hypothetical protein|nr:hypothetical protein [Bacteroidales bacterium]
MVFEDFMSLTWVIPVLAIIVGLFFALRLVFLWYYKIDDRLKEQQRTNELLVKLLTYYGVKIEEDENNNTITVKVKESGKIITVGLKGWEQMKKEYGEDSYEVVNK